MTNTTSPLHDAGFMRAFLDLVIPPSTDGIMPGAGQLGLAEEVAAAVNADDTLQPVISAGLLSLRNAAAAINPLGLDGIASAERLDLVHGVLTEHPMLMRAIARPLYLAYYQHPRVLEALGEPARPPFPEGFVIEPTDEQLLTRLRTRSQSSSR